MNELPAWVELVHRVALFGSHGEARQETVRLWKAHYIEANNADPNDVELGLASVLASAARHMVHRSLTGNATPVCLGLWTVLVGLIAALPVVLPGRPDIVLLASSITLVVLGLMFLLEARSGARAWWLRALWAGAAASAAAFAFHFFTSPLVRSDLIAAAGLLITVPGLLSFTRSGALGGTRTGWHWLAGGIGVVALANVIGAFEISSETASWKAFALFVPQALAALACVRIGTARPTPTSTRSKATPRALH